MPSFRRGILRTRTVTPPAEAAIPRTIQVSIRSSAVTPVIDCEIARTRAGLFGADGLARVLRPSR